MKIIDNIKNLFSRKYKPGYTSIKDFERIKVPPVCQIKFCGTKLNVINTYRCPYCNRFHCDKHRLPEEHGCTNPKNPYI